MPNGGKYIGCLTARPTKLHISIVIKVSDPWNTNPKNKLTIIPLNTPRNWLATRRNLLGSLLESDYLCFLFVPTASQKTKIHLTLIPLQYSALLAGGQTNILDSFLEQVAVSLSCSYFGMFSQCAFAGDTGYTKANCCEDICNLLKCKEKNTSHQCPYLFHPIHQQPGKQKILGQHGGNPVALLFFDLVFSELFFLPVLVSESPRSLDIPGNITKRIQTKWNAPKMIQILTIVSTSLLSL